MIKEGSKVKVHYTGKFENNEVFDSSKEREPIEFVVGEGNLIKGFENAVMGMEPGQNKTVTINAEEGYGERRKDLVQEIEKEKVPENVAVGQNLQANTPGGPINVEVVEVKENTVVLDANHPLAGKNLIFDIEVVETSEA